MKFRPYRISIPQDRIDSIVTGFFFSLLFFHSKIHLNIFSSLIFFFVASLLHSGPFDDDSKENFWNSKTKCLNRLQCSQWSFLMVHKTKKELVHFKSNWIDLASLRTIALDSKWWIKSFVTNVEKKRSEKKFDPIFSPKKNKFFFFHPSRNSLGKLLKEWRWENGRTSIQPNHVSATPLSLSLSLSLSICGFLIKDRRIFCPTNTKKKWKMLNKIKKKIRKEKEKRIPIISIANKRYHHTIHRNNQSEILLFNILHHHNDIGNDVDELCLISMMIIHLNASLGDLWIETEAFHTLTHTHTHSSLPLPEKTLSFSNIFRTMNSRKDNSERISTKSKSKTKLMKRIKIQKLLFHSKSKSY